MINVPARIKAAFQSDSMNKTYILSFIDGPTINNVKLASDSIVLTESLCSEEQLHYGCCESAMIELDTEYIAESFTGKIFDLYLILGDYEDDPFIVGRYIVNTEEVSTDRYLKSITAYDVMYVLNGLDVTYWYYNEISFPITYKDLRDSLLSYVGQEQVELELVNDAIEISEDFLNGDYNVTFEKVMKAICEWNAVFGHINREGKFTYISLDAADNEELYPSKTTFPSKTTYPASIRSKNYFIPQTLTKSEMSWENYMCKTVDTVQVRNRSGAVVLEYHIAEKETYTNVYVIQENAITDGMNAANMQTALQNFAEKIKKVTYKPCDVTMKMDLSFEVGDPVTFTSTDGTRIPTYIFKRTMEGIVSAFDEIEATGYEEWINDSPSNDGAVQDLIENVADLNDRVTDLESGDGQIQIISTDKLPTAPKKNVLYLIQGTVYVN